VLETLFPLILLALMVLLLFVLPARARKRMQLQTQAMQASLTVGTPVMTTSGIHGTVAALGDKTVDLEVAPGVVVTFARQAVLEVRTPATPGLAPGDGATGNGTNGTSGGRPADGTV
jgi:preprotein translocase subunit YajC